MSHTAGPWAVGETSIDGETVVEARSYDDSPEPVGVAIVAGHTPHAMSDARLIAAAPELLEALRQLCQSETVDRHDYEAAEQAILRAEGRA